MFCAVMEEKSREPNESKLFSQWLDRIDLGLFYPTLALLQPNTAAYLLKKFFVMNNSLTFAFPA